MLFLDGEDDRPVENFLLEVDVQIQGDVDNLCDVWKWQ